MRFHRQGRRSAFFHARTLTGASGARAGPWTKGPPAGYQKKKGPAGARPSMVGAIFIRNPHFFPRLSLPVFLRYPSPFSARPGNPTRPFDFPPGARSFLTPSNEFIATVRDYPTKDPKWRAVPAVFSLDHPSPCAWTRMPRCTREKKKTLTPSMRSRKKWDPAGPGDTSLLGLARRSPCTPASFTEAFLPYL